MLTYSSPTDLAEQPEAIKFLHVLILMALRDRTEQIEFRSTEEGWLL